MTGRSTDEKFYKLRKNLGYDIPKQKLFIKWIIFGVITKQAEQKCEAKSESDTSYLISNKSFQFSEI